MERAKYFSDDDWSVGHALERAEKVMAEYENGPQCSDINSALELYNIQKLLQIGARLPDWSEERFRQLMQKATGHTSTIAAFWKTVEDKNFSGIYKNTEKLYRDNFWEEFVRHKTYRRVSKATFQSFLKTQKPLITYILRQKEVVREYEQELAEHMMDDPQSAELLLDHYLGLDKVPRFLPKELSAENKMQILEEYIDSEDCNMNYLQSLLNGKIIKSKEFPVTPRLKRSAQKRLDEFWEKHFETHQGFKIVVNVELTPDCPEEAWYLSRKGSDLCAQYNINWFIDHLDFPTLLNNFIYLFGYVDFQFRSEFPAIASEMSELEKTMGIRGPQEYKYGCVFRQKSLLFHTQMVMFVNFLKQKGIAIEEIFQWFFETYLKEEFGVENFSFPVCASGASVLEKAKMIATEIERVFKQYKLYCENGKIDHELLELETSSEKIDSIPSLRENKYIYADGDESPTAQFLLFSDQTILGMVESCGYEYETLYDLLRKETIHLEAFADFQKHSLHRLIQWGLLVVDSEGILAPAWKKVRLLKDLYDKGVIVSGYYSDCDTALEELQRQKFIRCGSSLFSIPEQQYLNFMLNQAEYSNGHQLRNKYVHGSYPLNERKQQQDYIELLKIMVLIIIKINEEFCYRDAYREKEEDNSEPNG